MCCPTLKSRKASYENVASLSNPVMLERMTGQRLRSLYTTSCAFLQTPPKIPADCYRNGAALKALIEKRGLFDGWPCPILWKSRVKQMGTKAWTVGSLIRKLKLIIQPEALMVSSGSSNRRSRSSARPPFTLAICWNTGRRLSTFGRNPNPAGCLPGEI